MKSMWHSGWRTIDEQHRELFELVDQYQRALDEGGDVSSIHQALRTYAMFHFAHEESLMMRHAVPMELMRAHLAEHADFLARTEAPEAVDSRMLEFLTKWLLHHIGETDKAMLQCCQQQGTRT